MIAFEWNWEGVVDVVTSLLLAVFAMVVGALAKWRGAGRSYALFGVGFGLTIVFRSLAAAVTRAGSDEFTATSHVAHAVFILLSMAALAMWVVGILGLLREYGGGPYLWIGWAMVSLTALVAPYSLRVLGGTEFPASTEWLTVIGFSSVGVTYGLMAGAPLIMALARRREHQSGQAIMAVALGAYVITERTWGAVRPAVDGGPLGWTVLIGVVAYAALVIGWSLPGVAGRTGLAVITTGSLFLAGGFLTGLYYPRIDTASVARVFEVCLVAYAILRLQYLGIDAKVRIGISRSTVAAIFVAAIFLASEGAQLVFGDDQAWLGLLAGAGLVFVMAPLSRFADRVAVAAVPRTAEPPGAVDALVHLAQQLAADGSISPADRRALMVCAQAMGLGPVEVHDAIEGVSRSPST